jgi:hypothetical protein
MIYANFNPETGECAWCGETLGDVQLSAEFTGLFPKRYAMQNGVVVDKYSGKTDAEAEVLWLAEQPIAITNNDPS